MVLSAYQKGEHLHQSLRTRPIWAVSQIFSKFLPKMLAIQQIGQTKLGP
jgi:hypothetical protein